MQSGPSYQRIPPGYRFPYGDTHQQQEELYVVVGESGRMKLDDEIAEVMRWDVVRVPPGTWRGYEAGPEGLEILVFGAPNLGEDPRGDVEGQRDWWAFEPAEPAALAHRRCRVKRGCKRFALRQREMLHTRTRVRLTKRTCPVRAQPGAAGLTGCSQ